MHHAWWDYVGLSKPRTMDGFDAQKIELEE
jgi:hypothetical protein